MYSPHNDLHKMFYTPEFIVFRVDINGKEYLGRPNTIQIKHPFDPGQNQKAIFYTYSSIESFLQGNISKEIRVTAQEIKGLEAIDTVNSEPLNKLLSICNDLNNLSQKSDVGIIRRNIPVILSQLLIAIDEYENVHGCLKYDIAYESIEECVNDCRNCPYDLSEIGRANLIRDLKEKISVHVSNLIEFTKMNAA